MELTTAQAQVITEQQMESTTANNHNRFIEANTIQVELSHLKKDCIIPVFAKDNESTISHYEFIEAMMGLVQQLYPESNTLMLNIRKSHIVKGRIPSAIGKPVKELLDYEKTVYYERMAFMVEVPHIFTFINGHKLNLTIGGVRSYSEQNLFTKKSIEKFKVFIGFKNTVCCNLCISTDGLKDDLRVSSVDELKLRARDFFLNYDNKKHINDMKSLQNLTINQEQFAHLIGKMKLYNYLDKVQREGLFDLKTTDSQITTITKNYVEDEYFGFDADGYINLWKLYNLFTESAKINYIDNFLSRNCNSYGFVIHLADSLKNHRDSYFLKQVNLLS